MQYGAADGRHGDLVCALFSLVLFVNSVFCQNIRSSSTRDELLKIRATTPADLLPMFIVAPVDLLDILVKGALTFAGAVGRRRRRGGKRAGAPVCLHQCEHRILLLGIFISNVCSLCNKVDELQLRLGKNSDISSSSVLCFTETWFMDLYWTLHYSW